MSEDSRSHSPEPSRPAGRSSPAAAVPFLKRKLDELYQVLRGARYANALIDAEASLEARDYREALRLIRGARDFHARAPSKDWKKRAAEILGDKDPGKELLGRFAMVLSLVEKMSDAQEREPKPAVASPPRKPTAHRPAGVAADESSEGPPGVSPLTPKLSAATALDMGAFTQLLTSAQQSGLVPNADAIISVRDREYPTGRYQRALDVIEGLYAQMNAQAARRQQDLRREEMQYRAGTLKMSPKEWLLRQRHVREQTQNIERARRHFARVLDGLRVLRASAASGKETIQ